LVVYGSGTDAAPPRSIFGPTWGDGVTKAEEYRTKARECEERAAQTRDSFSKQQMLEIAAKWRQMADSEEEDSRPAG